MYVTIPGELVGAAVGPKVFAVLNTTTTLVYPVSARQVDNLSLLFTNFAFTLDMFVLATATVKSSDIPVAALSIKFGTNSKTMLNKLRRDCN